MTRFCVVLDLYKETYACKITGNQRHDSNLLVTKMKRLMFDAEHEREYNCDKEISNLVLFVFLKSDVCAELSPRFASLAYFQCHETDIILTTYKDE